MTEIDSPRPLQPPDLQLYNEPNPQQIPLIPRPRGLAKIGSLRFTRLAVRYPTPMATELDNVDLAEITFVKRIFQSKSTSGFLVNISNHECMMKVVSYSPTS